MKACKFCNTQMEDTAQRCPSCGSNVFLHVCDNCGTLFDSGFCPNCGVKAGQKKKTCPECNSVYFTNACPNCGYTPSRKPVVQEVVHKHVYVEPEPRPQPTPTQARQVKKKNKGCGCLTWILIILVVGGIIGSRSTSKKTTSNYSHSLTLNTFCIINVCLIPGGDSDSLWYSYSSAYTAFGYQNVIMMITGGLVAMKNEWFPHTHYTIRCACFQYNIGSFIGSYRLTKVDPIFDT